MIIDKATIETENFGELLAIYRLLPSFNREIAIDRAIAAITIEPEEINLALQQFHQRYKLVSQEAIQNYCQFFSLTDEQLKAIQGDRPTRV